MDGPLLDTNHIHDVSLSSLLQHGLVLLKSGSLPPHLYTSFQTCLLAHETIRVVVGGACFGIAVLDVGGLAQPSRILRSKVLWLLLDKLSPFQDFMSVRVPEAEGERGLRFKQAGEGKQQGGGVIKSVSDWLGSHRHSTWGSAVGEQEDQTERQAGVLCVRMPVCV